jgi:hypothetical protein
MTAAWLAPPEAGLSRQYASPAQQSPGGFSLPHKACDTVSLKLLTNAMVMLVKDHH